MAVGISVDSAVQMSEGAVANVKEGVRVAGPTTEAVMATLDLRRRGAAVVGSLEAATVRNRVVVVEGHVVEVVFVE